MTCTLEFSNSQILIRTSLYYFKLYTLRHVFYATLGFRCAAYPTPPTGILDNMAYSGVLFNLIGL